MLTNIFDYAMLRWMETMPISKFKATCLAVMQRVKRTRRPVMITRYGQPVAEVVPPSRPVGKVGWIGSMEGTAMTVGDIVSPVVDPDEWEALRR
ncbi:MAG TPA: type II toxin-antitoxin system Phd/YefM family antitoxin [Casimicrobiaceae bacterium]